MRSTLLDLGTWITGPSQSRYPVRPPNGLQISCRRSCSRPHKLTLPLLGLEEGDAPAEPRPTPACRLHLRVRHQPWARSPISTGARRTGAPVARLGPSGASVRRAPRTPSGPPAASARHAGDGCCGRLPNPGSLTHAAVGIRPDHGAAPARPMPGRRTRRQVPR
jgi:hypothetical protein